MANPLKGEVEFEAGGRTRTLCLNTNAICTLEDDLDLGMREILGQLDGGRLTAIRAAFRAGLDGERVTLQEAAELIDEIGYVAAVELLARAVAAAFPPREEANGSRPPPLAPPNGTGAGSSSSGSPPALPKPRSGRALPTN